MILTMAMKIENSSALHAIFTGYLLCASAGALAFSVSPIGRLAPRSRRSTLLRSTSGEKLDKPDLDPWFLSDDRFSPASLRTKSSDSSSLPAPPPPPAPSGQGSEADDQDWFKSDERFSPNGLQGRLDRMNGTSKKNGSASPYQVQQRKVESTNGFSTTDDIIKVVKKDLMSPEQKGSGSSTPPLMSKVESTNGFSTTDDIIKVVKKDVMSPEQKGRGSNTPPPYVQQRKVTPNQPISTASAVRRDQPLQGKKALMSPWLNIGDVNQYGSRSRVGGIRPEHRAVNTAPSAREVAKEDAGPTKYTGSQRVASLQSCLIGAVVGMIAISPITALHHLYDPYLFPSYQGLGQWEWDTVTALLQGGFFAVVYRYSVRDEVEAKDLQTIIFIAFVLIRSLVRVHVPLDCTALPLQCSDPLEGMGMLGEFSINVVESWALFGTVATAMNSLLKRGWIFRFPK